MEELIPNLLLTALGGLIGIVGSLSAVVLSNCIARRNQRLAVASRFLQQAQMLGTQISREARRADDLDLPIPPGWDLSLIAEREEIALRLGEEAEQSAQKVIDSLTAMVTGTVGPIMCFDDAMQEFRALYWELAGQRRKDREKRDEDPVVSNDPNGEVGT